MKIETSFHTNFKLQDKSFDNFDELIDFSRSISLEINSFLKEWFSAEGFVEVKTSGSTGMSKVIRIQKKHMVHSAMATGEYFNLGSTSKALLCMSPAYIAGKMMVIRALEGNWN